MPVLYVIACGAGPADDLAELVTLAHERGWDVCVGTTPAGWSFIHHDEIQDLTGREPRRDFSGRSSGWPPADGIIVAPATISTVNKFALGITDNWAVCSLVESMGLGVPIVFAPNVNPALSSHPRYRANLTEIQRWHRIQVLLPADPESRPWMVPWSTMLDALDKPPDIRRPDA